MQRFRRLLASGESGLDRSLVRRGIKNEFCKFSGAEVADGEKMPRPGSTGERASLELSHCGFDGAASGTQRHDGDITWASQSFKQEHSNYYKLVPLKVKERE